MPDVTRKKTVEYKWICTDKSRCGEIDDQIDALTLHASQLSSYVEHKNITGLECLYLDSKFKWALKELREERKSLWRRVRRETEEEITTDTPAAEPVEQEKYTSPFAPPNMERVL